MWRLNFFGTVSIKCLLVFFSSPSLLGAKRMLRSCVCGFCAWILPTGGKTKVILVGSKASCNQHCSPAHIVKGHDPEPSLASYCICPLRIGGIVPRLFHIPGAAFISAEHRWHWLSQPWLDGQEFGACGLVPQSAELLSRTLRFHSAPLVVLFI